MRFEIDRRFSIVSASSITKIEIKEKDEKCEQINWPTQLTCTILLAAKFKSDFMCTFDFYW